MTRSRSVAQKVIIPFNPEIRLAIEHLRQIANGKTGKIFWRDHAKQQMAKRGILMRDALRVLEYGEPVIFHQGKRRDEIEIKMSFRPSGLREIAVVTAIINSTGVARILTVMWRDENAKY